MQEEIVNHPHVHLMTKPDLKTFSTIQISRVGRGEIFFKNWICREFCPLQKRCNGFLPCLASERRYEPKTALWYRKHKIATQISPYSLFEK